MWLPFTRGMKDKESVFTRSAVIRNDGQHYQQKSIHIRHDDDYHQQHTTIILTDEFTTDINKRQLDRFSINCFHSRSLDGGYCFLLLRFFLYGAITTGMGGWGLGVTRALNNPLFY